MSPHIATPATTVAQLPGQSDRRHGNRTPTLFFLIYFGMETGQMLIGEGIVTDLSSSGIGVGINRSHPAWKSPSSSTFLERKSHSALPRAESPGLKDVDSGWRWRP